MYTTSDQSQTLHQTIWLLSMSKKRGVDPAALRSATETYFGGSLDSNTRYGRVSLIYYWLAGLRSGCLSAGDVPVQAHRVLSYYARTPACQALAEQLITDALRIRA
jgi:hypothetical protein